VGTPGSASAETRRPAAVEKAEAYLGSAASRISAEQPSTPKWARTAETAAVRAGASLPTPQIPAAAGASIGSAASTSANAVASLPAGAAQALNEREEHWRGAGLQLVERVVPRYPTLAESERLQGEVVLVATIAKDGRVADVRPVSGPAVLASSAVDAVRQWRFRPYQVDGKPVQVQTNIRVNFNLDK
jgi:TonB family protein